MKLPPNTTIVHSNLIVPAKPGRPNPATSPAITTTQYPVYPVVAGITNWPSHPPTLNGTKLHIKTDRYLDSTYNIFSAYGISIN